MLNLLSAFFSVPLSSNDTIEKSRKPQTKSKKSFTCCSCLNLCLPKLSQTFQVHLTQWNQWIINNYPGFPALPILLTVKLYSVSNHMHPNKGFKVWIETETVSALSQQMQRNLAMFPLLARKAWKSWGPSSVKGKGKRWSFCVQIFASTGSLTHSW